LIASRARIVKLIFAMKGCFVFHITMRVPVLLTLDNPSWHLTASRRTTLLSVTTFFSPAAARASARSSSSCFR
jgi:hypothetical protein